MADPAERTWPRFAAAIALMLAVAAALAWSPAGEALTGALAAIEDLGPAGPLAFGVLYAVATLALVPATPFSLAAGFVWGPGIGLLAAWGGEILGAWLAFVAARTLLRGPVERRLGGWPRLRAVDVAIGRQGAGLLVLLRLSPLFPFGLLNYALGLSRARPVDYLWTTAVGTLPACAWLVWTGSTVPDLSAALSGAAEPGLLGELALSAVGLAVTAVAVIRVTRAGREALAEILDPPGA